MRLEDVVEVDPEKLGGDPVFRGTRVPIQNLFDYLKGGDSVERFLDHFPTVEREQAMALLDLMQENAVGAASLTAEQITALVIVEQTRGTIKGLDRETIIWLAEDEELCEY